MRIEKLKYNGKNTVLYQNKIDIELLEKAFYFLELEDNENDKNLLKYKNAKKRTRHVFRFEINKKIYYCKKYVNNNFFKIVEDFFRNQRAIRAFKLSIYLNNLSIQTIKPILAIVDSKRLFHRTSVLITEECKGITLKNTLLEEIKSEDKKNILEKIVQLYLKLIKMKIYHRDPNLSNFMLFENNLIIIDLDDIRKFSMYSFGKIFRILERFNEKLLLCFTRNKEIYLYNIDRVNIIKKLIDNSIYNIDNSKYFEMINLFTRFKMKKHFNSKENLKRYLNGGTVREVDRNLSLYNLSTFNRILKHIFL